SSQRGSENQFRAHIFLPKLGPKIISVGEWSQLDLRERPQVKNSPADGAGEFRDLSYKKRGERDRSAEENFGRGGLAFGGEVAQAEGLGSGQAGVGWIEVDVATPEAARFGGEAEGPFEAEVLHPVRRLRYVAGDEWKCGADGEYRHVEKIAKFISEDFL